MLFINFSGWLVGTKQLHFILILSSTGPMELYQHPLTTSNEYGWWLKNGAPHREEWVQSERHAHVNSEMTS